MPLYHLSRASPFRATGRVLALQDDVRYLARWVFVADQGSLRIQVFAMEGSMIADIVLRNDDLRAVIPQERECHRGSISSVPLALLLGLEIDWEGALMGLRHLLWPGDAKCQDWVAGRVGNRTGWLCTDNEVFLSPNPQYRVPEFLRVGLGKKQLTAEIDSYVAYGNGYLPSEIAFFWPSMDARMWLEIETRELGPINERLFDLECPESSTVILW